MSSITLSWMVSGQLVDATSVVLADSSNPAVFGIKSNVDDSVAVAPLAAVAHTGTGQYSYDTSLLDPNVPYTASWQVTTEWGVEYVLELILPVMAGQCTLADVERETALRLGPYERRVVGDSTSNTGKTIYVPKLKTALDLGGLEDRYILRRGYLQDGTPIANFNPDDRQRIVVTYTAADGLLEIDRDYNNAAVANEAIEIHYLDPETELRPLVQTALADKVKLADRVSVKFPSLLLEQDITALCPWIQETSQIRDMASAFTKGLYLPTLISWFQPFMKDGNVWVTMQPTPFPFSALIYEWRYASSLVNGAYSVDGPTDDNDLLYVNPRYAAAGCHIRAFLYGNTRPRIMEGVRKGLFINQAMAAEEFEDQATRHFKPMARRNMTPAPGLEPGLVVNGPTLRQ